MEKPAIVELLTQWNEDHRHEMQLASPIGDFAEEIASLSNGHPGVVGFCCAQLEKEVEQANQDKLQPRAYRLFDYQTFSCQELSRLLEDSPGFSRLFKELWHLLTASKHELLKRVGFCKCLDPPMRLIDCHSSSWKSVLLLL